MTVDPNVETLHFQDLFLNKWTFTDSVKSSKIKEAHERTYRTNEFYYFKQGIQWFMIYPLLDLETIPFYELRNIVKESEISKIPFYRKNKSCFNITFSNSKRYPKNIPPAGFLINLTSCKSYMYIFSSYTTKEMNSLHPLVNQRLLCYDDINYYISKKSYASII